MSTNAEFTLFVSSRSATALIIILLSCVCMYVCEFITQDVCVFLSMWHSLCVCVCVCLCVCWCVCGVGGGWCVVCVVFVCGCVCVWHPPPPSHTCRVCVCVCVCVRHHPP